MPLSCSNPNGVVNEAQGDYPPSAVRCRTPRRAESFHVDFLAQGVTRLRTLDASRGDSTKDGPHFATTGQGMIVTTLHRDLRSASLTWRNVAT